MDPIGLDRFTYSFRGSDFTVDNDSNKEAQLSGTLTMPYAINMREFKTKNRKKLG